MVLLQSTPFSNCIGIKSWQNAGKVVTLSVVGGENVSWTTVFVIPIPLLYRVQQTVAQYGLNGVDLDIENGTTTHNKLPMQLIFLKTISG